MCILWHIDPTPDGSVCCDFNVCRLCGYPPFRAKDEGTLYDLIREAKVEFEDEVWSSVSEACEYRTKEF